MIEQRKSVEYYFPESVKTACEIKHKFGEDARFIAGGTDLLLLMEREGYRPKALIDINRIPELKLFSVNYSNVSIGAAVTYNEILSSGEFCEKLPFVEKSIRTIGGVQVRNVATIVGNISNASPAADTLPPLYVLKTKVHISNGTTVRVQAIEDFVLGVRKTDLGPSELITHISLDLPRPGFFGEFDKLGLRKAMAISVVSVAILCEFNADVIKDINIALGSVASTVLNIGRVKDFLTGQALNAETIEEAAKIASESAYPIDDVRASARYRQLAVAGMVKRSLSQLEKKNRILYANT